MSSLGNPTASVSRSLKSICGPGIQKRVNRKRGHSSIHNIDSRSEDWREIADCIDKHITSGYLTVEIISERPGVFRDCKHCDNLLRGSLHDHAEAFAEPMYVGHYAKVFKLDAQSLSHICRTLSNPARPKCGNDLCLKRPTPKDEYVATLWIYFKDGLLHVDFFSEGTVVGKAPNQPTKKRKTKE